MGIFSFKPVTRSLRKVLMGSNPDELAHFVSQLLMIPMALQTVKACEDTSAAGALETSMILAGRPGAVGGPGMPRSVNVSAAECACH